MVAAPTAVQVDDRLNCKQMLWYLHVKLLLGTWSHDTCIFTARKRSLRRLCFYRCLSVHTGGRAWFYLGGHMVLFGGHAWFYSGGHAWFYLGGHAWFYSGGVHGFIRGGVNGFIRGACMVLLGGRVWFYLGGVHGFIWGACMVLFGGVCIVLFGGACVVLFGGCAWFYSGGMRGFIRGACVVLFGGHAWFYLGGACMVFSFFSDSIRYGQWAGGTHPTGMHSCSVKVHIQFPINKLQIHNVAVALVFTNNTHAMLGESRKRCFVKASGRPSS